MPSISKYSSMVYRFGQIYFDEQLAPYHIGCGQQFFLLHIAQKPGINQYELAMIDQYDKGTCARAVKKLEEQGYIDRKVDENDRRITKLYVTKRGQEIVKIVQNILFEWYTILTEGLNREEQIAVATLMGKVANNANVFIRNR